jgi:hypothetical protein
MGRQFPAARSRIAPGKADPHVSAQGDCTSSNSQGGFSERAQDDEDK